MSSFLKRERKYTLLSVAKLSVLYVVFYWLLVMHYYKFISIVFGYEGFYLNINYNKVFVSQFLLICISFLFFNLRLNKPSTHLFNIMIFVSVIPMLVLWSVENLDTSFILYILLCLLVTRFTLNLRIYGRINFINFKLFEILSYLLFIMVLISLFIFNMKYFNLNIEKVYSYRYLIARNTPKLLAYLENVILKGVIPLLFLFYLFNTKNLKKIVFYSMVMVLLYILIFGLTSHKFFLFLIPFELVIYFLFRKSQNISYIILSSLIIFTAVLIFLMYWNPYLILLEDLLIRRVLFVPADINFKYYEFFSKNPFVYFSDSKFLPIRYFVTYPYNTDISHLIGREMYGHPMMAANTSWIGTGFAHMGFLGMLIYALILGLIFKYIDFFSKFLDYKFLVISFFPYVDILFLSADLKTALLTHGFLLYLVSLNIFSFYNKNHNLRTLRNPDR